VADVCACIDFSLFKKGGGCVNGSAERTAVDESLRSSAIVLWTLASALWLVVLNWMLGITQKGSL
jgi:hypothetical protein